MSLTSSVVVEVLNEKRLLITGVHLASHAVVMLEQVSDLDLCPVYKDKFTLGESETVQDTSIREEERKLFPRPTFVMVRQVKSDDSTMQQR